jgi:hypothetical protein
MALNPVSGCHNLLVFILYREIINTILLFYTRQSNKNSADMSYFSMILIKLEKKTPFKLFKCFIFFAQEGKSSKKQKTDPRNGFSWIG